MPVAHVRFGSSAHFGYDRTMCIICIEFEKGAMTTAEARRALGEMVEKVGREHASEVAKKLDDADDSGGVRSGSGGASP